MSASLVAVPHASPTHSGNTASLSTCAATHALLQGPKFAYYWSRIADCTPRWQRLLAAARSANMEVIHTVIQSLTHDGRDRSLDYKISGFHVPPGCWDAQVWGQHGRYWCRCCCSQCSGCLGEAAEGLG